MMTTEAIEQFRQQVGGDPGLQAKFVQAYEAGPDALANLGRECGYAFTAEEAAGAIQHHLSDGELSDFELELIAGGDAGGSNPDCQKTSGAGRSN